MYMYARVRMCVDGIVAFYKNGKFVRSCQQQLLRYCFVIFDDDDLTKSDKPNLPRPIYTNEIFILRALPLNDALRMEV